MGNIRKNWKKILPFAALSGVWTVMIVAGSGYFSYRVTALQQQYYMAKGYDNPLIQIPVAITSYLRLIFWPDRLSFYQSDFIYTPLFYTLLNITFISFIVFIIFSFFRFKYAFFWLSLLFISLSPSLTPLRISWWVAERYIYLGSAGVIAVAGMLLSRLSNRKSFRYFVYLSVVVFTLALFTRTIVRNNDWKTQDDLWIATGRTAPMDPKTHNNLGDMYARHGDYANAIKEFEIATKLQTNYADGYHNLAVVYAEIKKYDKAIENLNLALKINPKIWQSEMLLANIYLNTKDYQNSLIHVLKATELNPALATFASAGYIYRESGDRSKAKEYFTKALTFDPNNQDIQKAVSELGN
jgi:tetratricopeptide (TPR) repeat protein